MMELHNALLCISRQTGVKEVFNGSRFCNVTLVGHSNTFLSRGNRRQKDYSWCQLSLYLFANRRTFDHFGCEWSYHAIGSSSLLILLANSNEPAQGPGNWLRLGAISPARCSGT